MGQIFGTVMKWCYDITKNYGLAIILFTVFSKIVLLPVSVWVQKKSIKMKWSSTFLCLIHLRKEAIWHGVPATNVFLLM